VIHTGPVARASGPDFFGRAAISPHCPTASGEPGSGNSHHDRESSLFENAVILDSKKHTGLGYRPVIDFSYARNVLSAPLAGTEVLLASREFPIVFPTTGRGVPVALMGYAPDSNLWVASDGSWAGRYVPAHLRRYPFVLGEQSGSDRFVLMVEPTAMSGDGTGEPLFENDKVPEGGIVDRARNFLTTFQRELTETEAFFEPLRKSDVLVSRVFTVRKGKEQIGQVRDLQIVDTDKLAALDDATLAGWVRSGLMAMVIAHLHSLQPDLFANAPAAPRQQA